jgi:hypothetical protein
VIYLKLIFELTMLHKGEVTLGSRSVILDKYVEPAQQSIDSQSDEA